MGLKDDMHVSNLFLTYIDKTRICYNVSYWQQTETNVLCS